MFGSVGTKGVAGAAGRLAGMSWTSSVRLSGIQLNGLPIAELIVTPLTLRIFPVDVSPTQSSTRLAAVFRKAKCFPSPLHSRPLIFAPGGTSILISEPSATRLSVNATEYWKRCGEFDAGLMRRPAIRSIG